MMEEHKLSFEDLHISLSEIYEVMGYGSDEPDEEVKREIQKLLSRVASVTRPLFSFFLAEGKLRLEKEELEVSETVFQIGKIIARQLRVSQEYAFFVATAGREFEQLQQVLKEEGDIVAIYMADSLGSIIAEKTADCMEEALQGEITRKGWKHTNRFSPGYCGWHVSEQQKLFPLFPTPHPCGIHLTDSSLMLPIKSVSGVIGLGEHVRKVEYTCGLCNYEKCYRRKRREGVTLV